MYPVNQSLCRLGKKNVGVEKVECRLGGDSRVRRVCVMLNAADVSVNAFLSRSRNRLTFELSLTIS